MKNIQLTRSPLYIGSRKRLHFPMSKQFAGFTLLVEPQEHNAYRSVYSSVNRVVSLKENDRGFGYMLNSLIQQAYADDQEYFMFCDDDILGFKHRNKKAFSMDEMFREGVQIMQKHGYSQLMVSFAGHNWFHQDQLKEKIGAWCCFIGRTVDFLEVGGYDEQLPIFNDWDMSARLIRAGKTTACWYDYMFMHKMKSLKGGAEDLYKKTETTQLAIALLRERYGAECIRTVEAHGQIEARFNWKKL